MTLEHTSAITASSSRTSASVDVKGKRSARHSWSRRSTKWSADDSSRNSRCSGRCAGPIFCCRPERGSSTRIWMTYSAVGIGNSGRNHKRRSRGGYRGLGESGWGVLNDSEVVERQRYERQIGLRLFLCQFAVNPQRLLKFLPSRLHPALVAIKNPQVVKRRRYGRQIGLRLFLRQLTVGLQRFLKFLTSRLDPVRRAIVNTRVVEPVRGSDIFPRWFSRGLPSESAQIVRGTWISCRRLVNDCDFYNGRTSRLVRDNYIRQARRIDPQTCERQQNYATEAPEHRSDGPRGLSDSSSSFFTRVTVRENCAESCCAKLRPAQA